MRNRGAQLRLKTILDRKRVDYDWISEEDPPFFCLNCALGDGPYAYLTFMDGNRIEFWFSDDGRAVFNLDRDEDVAFGRFLRETLKYLSY
jgi:hypothetical protein